LNRIFVEIEHEIIKPTIDGAIYNEASLSSLEVFAELKYKFLLFWLRHGELFVHDDITELLEVPVVPFLFVDRVSSPPEVYGFPFLVLFLEVVFNNSVPYLSRVVVRNKLLLLCQWTKLH
jgi:hypothetical protein